MTAHALLGGVLYCEPERRTAKSGKPLVIATIRIKHAMPFESG
jgi:hypothetical protein